MLKFYELFLGKTNTNITSFILLYWLIILQLWNVSSDIVQIWYWEVTIHFIINQESCTETLFSRQSMVWRSIYDRRQCLARTFSYPMQLQQMYPWKTCIYCIRKMKCCKYCSCKVWKVCSLLYAFFLFSSSSTMLFLNILKTLSH